MYNIAIIGAGQLGSRHLQGLKLAQMDMSIYVVDSSQESLQTAMERYEEVAENTHVSQIEYLDTIDQLPNHLDFVVIATSSKPRLSILKSLLNHAQVENLILEKILFQSLSEYTQATTLLEEHNLIGKTWVNCPRREFEGYAALKQHIDPRNPIAFTMSGSDWGLGCNALHYIDIFSYLTDQCDIEYQTTELDTEIIESKRGGYIEFTGTLNGQTERGDTLRISSLSEAGIPSSFTIEIPTGTIIIDESSDTIQLPDNQTIPINLKYQSQLTGALVQSILEGNGTTLTTFTESVQLHKPLISSLLDFYNKQTDTINENCPIT